MRGKTTTGRERSPIVPSQLAGRCRGGGLRLARRAGPRLSAKDLRSSAKPRPCDSRLCERSMVQRGQTPTAQWGQSAGQLRFFRERHLTNSEIVLSCTHNAMQTDSNRTARRERDSLLRPVTRARRRFGDFCADELVPPSDRVNSNSIKPNQTFRLVPPRSQVVNSRSQKPAAAWPEWPWRRPAIRVHPSLSGLIRVNPAIEIFHGPFSAAFMSQTDPSRVNRTGPPAGQSSGARKPTEGCPEGGRGNGQQSNRIQPLSLNPLAPG